MPAHLLLVTDMAEDTYPLHTHAREPCIVSPCGWCCAAFQCHVHGLPKLHHKWGGCGHVHGTELHCCQEKEVPGGLLHLCAGGDPVREQR